jgi:hypothetical protein
MRLRKLCGLRGMGKLTVKGASMASVGCAGEAWAPIGQAIL